MLLPLLKQILNLTKKRGGEKDAVASLLAGIQ
jgi:hypothetical protein